MAGAYNLTSMRYLVLFLCTLPIFGQSLRVSSATATPGKKTEVEIALDSPAGKEPLALQWEVGFSADAFKLDKAGLVAGPAAHAAGKSLTCAAKKNAGPTAWVCILAGGQKPIASGVVAVLHLDVQPGAGDSRAIVVDNAMAVSAALKKLPISRVAATVKVTR